MFAGTLYPSRRKRSVFFIYRYTFYYTTNIFVQADLPERQKNRYYNGHRYI